MNYGEYEIRIELISGERLRVDYIRFLPSSTGAETDGAASWGTIKAMFR